MSCQKNCPSGRAYSLPRERLDQVRRKLEFSGEVSESPIKPPPPANKYEHFRKVSESHSSQHLEQPMFTSAEMAAVPESFLEMFRDRIGTSNPPPQARTATSPSYPCGGGSREESEMPESFLEFCKERLDAMPSTRTPYKPSPRFEGSYHVPGPTPYGNSYNLGGYYDMPGTQYGYVFSPKLTSSRMESSPCSPSAPPKQERLYKYKKQTVTRAPAHDTGNYAYPLTRTTGSPVMGIGKYACAASNSPPTPPTPSECGHCSRGTRSPPFSSSMFEDSSVSSGDLLRTTPKQRSKSRKSRGTCPESPQASAASRSCPGAQSPDQGPKVNYIITTVKEQRSTSSMRNSQRKQELSETVCSDDFTQSRSNNCPNCPTLGVTPVQSSMSLASSCGGNASTENRQNIVKNIENELLAREEQERRQLETDLMRWQQARRKLVMNTANMGA